jgi:hypothetical protein
MTLFWDELALFMLATVFIALYGLTVSGHFPAELRAPALKNVLGTTTIWATLVAVALAAIIAITGAVRALPWPASIIGGGAMLLFAPLLLRLFPDRFVNGHLALLAFAGGALLAALAFWIAA